MITSIIFLRRRPGLSRAAFHEHWRERHAPLVLRLPGLRRYVQNFPLDADAVFDGIAESSFDDAQAMKALAQSAGYAAVLADEPGFIDRAQMGAIVTEAQLLKEGAAPAGGVKRIAFVAKPAAVTVEEFFRRWAEDGARRAGERTLRRYAQCRVRASVYASGRKPAYDGASFAWYETAEGARSAAPEFGEAAALCASERVVL